jgi:outer membrane biosynthesis protein TonB
MPTAAEVFSRYRVVALALAASAAVHAALMMGVPRRIATLDDDRPPLYEADLQAVNLDAPPAATIPAPPAPVAKPRARRAKSPHPKSRIAPPPPPPPVEMPAPVAAQPPAPPAPPEPVVVAKAEVPKDEPKPQPPPEKVALAQPAVPVKALAPPEFPTEALPANITIDYKLTSAFADGHATYRWARDGDSYHIEAEAQAEGFFALFLEGRIIQEASGTVTSLGLRPEKFSERKPGGPPEGLEFDWAGRQVTFDRNGEKKTSELKDNTVDWLSMIFQLAHTPPSAQAFDLQVFTQRRMYRFRLAMLGIEEVETPMGTVRAQHLRHVDPENPKEVVDVWLGVDQHYLPVKLRYPVARNRVVVEQVATRISE